MPGELGGGRAKLDCKAYHGWGPLPRQLRMRVCGGVFSCVWLTLAVGGVTYTRTHVR